MTLAYPTRAPRKQQLVLPAVAAVHIAALWLWQADSALPPDSPVARRTIFLEFVAPKMTKQPPPSVISAPAVRRRDRPRPKLVAKPVTLVRSAPASAPANPEPATEATVIAPDPFAQAAEAPPPFSVQAKKDAVQFDKQTNKDRLKGITSFDERPFAKAMGGAYVSTGTTLTEYKSADGRPITKVTRAGRSYCVTTLEGNSIMADSMRRQGASTRQVSCPK